jgi:hypothetical protein
MYNEPLESPPPPPTHMLGKTVLVNLGILVFFLLTSLVFVHETGISVLTFAVAILTGFNFFFGIIFLFTPKWFKIGQSMMIASLIVAAVGFVFCWARTGI